jgi:hypothetical protein
MSDGAARVFSRKYPQLALAGILFCIERIPHSQLNRFSVKFHIAGADST